MKRKKLQKKGGISLAWDNMGFFILALIALIVIIVIIVQFSKSGTGFFDLLGGLF